MSKQCPTITPKEFTGSCEPIEVNSQLPMVYFDPNTGRVFDEFRNYIGSGRLGQSGEFMQLDLNTGMRLPKNGD